MLIALSLSVGAASICFAGDGVLGAGGGGLKLGLAFGLSVVAGGGGGTTSPPSLTLSAPALTGRGGGGGGGGGGPKFDQAGTFVGSSFLYATARDFARLPYLYSSSNDGVGGWGGHRRRILPPGWAAYAHRCTGMDASSGNAYGAHWWVNMFGNGTFSCNGFEGQYAIAAPEEHLVVVRLGKSSDGESSSQKNNVVTQLGALVRELAPTQPGAVGMQAKL